MALLPPLLLAAALSSGALAAPLVRVAEPLPGVPELPCATPRLLPTLLPPPSPSPVPPPGGAKVEREAIDGVREVRTSDNFAVKWGSGGSISEQTASELLDALEQAYAVEVDEMGHPGPYGSERYLVNVYIEDTGLTWSSGGSSFELSGSGASGYFYSDPEGYPMLVMSQRALEDADYSAMVAAHEHFHAVQAATGAYPYSGVSAWYWEASATWASGEVFPEIPDYSVFLFGFALLPWLPVDVFDYPDTAALVEYHQYGAFIFPRYISEHLADWTVIRDSWVDPDPGGDPLVALDQALADWDSSVEEALAGMASHNAVWDYADGQVYADNVATYEALYSEAQPVLEEYHGSGSGDWSEAPADEQLQRLGHALVGIDCAGADAVSLELELDEAGSAGSPARWQAVLVSETTQGPVYQELELDGGAASWSSDCGTQQHWLAVSVGSAERVEGEVFTWRHLVLFDGEEVQPDDQEPGPASPGGSSLPTGEPAACACAGAPAGGGLLLALLPLWWRRRR